MNCVQILTPGSKGRLAAEETVPEDAAAAFAEHAALPHLPRALPGVSVCTQFACCTSTRLQILTEARHTELPARVTSALSLLALLVLSLLALLVVECKY